MKIRVKLISTVQYLLLIVQRKGDEKSIRMYIVHKREEKEGYLTKIGKV